MGTAMSEVGECNTTQEHRQMYYTAVRVTAGDVGGSGICIHSQKHDGKARTFVITNHHVIENLIEVDKEWDSTLKREYPQETTNTADIEFFNYNNYSKSVGSDSYKAEILAYDHKDKRDIGLLELKEQEKTMDFAADLYPKDHKNDIYMFDEVYAVGAALGIPAFQTPGEITNVRMELEGQEFIGTNSPITFGNCLTGDSKVFTTEGIKSIENIEKGEEVYTHSKSGANTVLDKVSSGIKEVYELETSTRKIKASSNHPFLTAKKQVKKKDKNGRPIRVSYSLDWKQLKDIEKGAPLVIAHELEENNDNRVRTSSEEKARLEGFILGDGYTRYREGKGGETHLYCFDRDLAGFYKELAEKVFDQDIKITENNCVAIYSSEVAQELIDEGLGEAHIEAGVPQWIWESSKETKREFLRGFFDADGSKRSYGGYLVEINNKELAEELRALCMFAGFRVGKMSKRKRRKVNKNEAGMPIEGNRDSAYFYANTNVEREYSNVLGHDSLSLDLLEDGYRFDKVKSIKKIGKEETFDLKIQDAHNFVADGVVVHNSGGGLFKKGNDGNYYLIGLPARVSMQGFGDVANHIGFAIPIDKIYEFLDDNCLEFIYDSSYDYEDCMDRLEEKRSKAKKRLLGGEES